MKDKISDNDRMKLARRKAKELGRELTMAERIYDFVPASLEPFTKRKGDHQPSIADRFRNLSR